MEPSTPNSRLENIAKKLGQEARKGHHVFKSNNLATLGIVAAVCLVMANPGGIQTPTLPTSTMELVDLAGRKITVTVLKIADDKKSITVRLANGKQAAIAISKLSPETVAKILPPEIPAENPLRSKCLEFHANKAKADFKKEETCWDEAFIDIKHWDKLPAGDWRVESKTPSETKHTCTEIRDFLGGPARLVRVRMANETTIRNIEVLWVIQGLTTKGKDYKAMSKQELEKAREENLKLNAEFQASAKLAMDYIQTQLKSKFGEPTPGKVGKNPNFAVPVLDYKTGKGTTIRLYTPNQKWGIEVIMATIHKTEELAASDLAAKVATKPSRKSLKEREEKIEKNVERLPNGDVVINNIPMHDQGQTGGCAPASLSMILEYWGNPMPWERFLLRANEASATAKTLEQDKGAAEDTWLIYQMNAFDMNIIMEEIDAGRPVQISRFVKRDRSEIHIKWRDAAAADPAFRIPKESQEERAANWPTNADEGHKSIVTGYNKDKKEVMVTESWGEKYRHCRLTWEELEATSDQITTLRPTNGRQNSR